MEPFTTQAHIHSRDGALDEATILEKTGDNKFLAQVGDVKCSAIYNPYVGRYYVDDKYGVIHDQDSRGRDGSAR